MQLDPDVIRLFSVEEALHLRPFSQLSPEQAREAYREFIHRHAGPQIGMAEVRDMSAPGPRGPLPMRLYRPDSLPVGPAPVLFYIHGGGYVVGDLDSHDGVCRRVADRAECAVVAIEYGLGPEHPAPDAAEDVMAGLRWIMDHSTDLGVDVSRLAVAGDSAGGGLAAALTLEARDGATPTPLRCQILLYPSLDNRADPPAYPSREENRGVPPLTPETLEWDRKNYLPEPSLGDDWRVSPVIATDKSGLPPALVVVGQRDPLCSEGLAYADALEKAGVEVARMEVPDMIHGFITLGGTIGATEHVLNVVAAELRRRLAAA